MRQRSITLAAALLLAATCSAEPVFTPINAAPPSEPGHAAILHTLYGGVWNTSATLDFSNGAVSAVRVADGAMGASELLLGGDDRLWSAAEGTLAVRARHAGDRHRFGWIDDASGAAFSPIFTSNTLDIPLTMPLSENFRWALEDVTTQRTWTSNPADNLDAAGAPRDQLVTYRIDGVGGAAPRWLLMWEDRISGQNADYDYNDVVIEVSVVPAPPAFAALAVGAVVIAHRRRRPPTA